MARVKVKGAGGKTRSMDAAQAAQLGLATLENGVPTPTGALDIIPGAAQDGLQKGLENAKSALSEAKSKIGRVIGQTAALVSPDKQKSMFGAVQGKTGVNPQSDIMNINPNRWKNIQRKAGLQEF